MTRQRITTTPPAAAEVQLLAADEADSMAAMSASKGAVVNMEAGYTALPHTGCSRTWMQGEEVRCQL
jgi:hypothetical protein